VFVAALGEGGYDDVLAIENEDASLPPEASVEQAAEFIRPILAGV
jgi:sugar phosphate isomerase/epimerase